MTVISTIMTKWCTAVASDSLITIPQADGTKKPDEWEKSKINRIIAYRGSAAYWGLASCGSWKTYDWLQSRCNEGHKFDSLEAFAQALRDSLAQELSKITFAKPLDGGIGIHLTGYENIDGNWIPELFLCTNFKDTSYSELCCLHITRESYHTVANEAPHEKHREARYRHAVKDFLQNNGLLIYNNGDPVMFNPTANAFFQLMSTVRQRGLAKNDNDADTHRALVKRPIEIIAEAQRDFCRDGMRIVGGRVHDLVVTPKGDYSSSSGD